MSTWIIPPALRAIRADANNVAPNRNKASDGDIGDLTHQSQGSGSDHNPDARGVVHAVDITHDPAHGMDTWYWAQIIADRIKSGAETRVKYLVANDGDKDVIFNPSVSMTWRQNGSFKNDHRNHLHTSILSTLSAENDVRPFFVRPGGVTQPPEEDVTPEEHAWLKDIHAALPQIRDVHAFLTTWRDGWKNEGSATDAQARDGLRKLRANAFNAAVNTAPKA